MLRRNGRTIQTNGQEMLRLLIFIIWDQ